MLITIDLKNDPYFKEGWKEDRNETWNKAGKEFKYKIAKNLLKYNTRIGLIKKAIRLSKEYVEKLKG